MSFRRSWEQSSPSPPALPGLGALQRWLGGVHAAPGRLLVSDLTAGAALASAAASDASGGTSRTSGGTPSSAPSLQIVPVDAALADVPVPTIYLGGLPAPIPAGAQTGRGLSGHASRVPCHPPRSVPAVLVCLRAWLCFPPIRPRVRLKSSAYLLMHPGHAFPPLVQGAPPSMPTTCFTSCPRGSCPRTAFLRGTGRPGAPPPASQAGVITVPRSILSWQGQPSGASAPGRCPARPCGPSSPSPAAPPFSHHRPASPTLPCCADPISAYNICQAGQLDGRRVVLTERGVAEQLARGTTQVRGLAASALSGRGGRRMAALWHAPAPLTRLMRCTSLPAIWGTCCPARPAADGACASRPGTSRRWGRRAAQPLCRPTAATQRAVRRAAADQGCAGSSGSSGGTAPGCEARQRQQQQQQQRRASRFPEWSAGGAGSSQ